MALLPPSPSLTEHLSLQSKVGEGRLGAVWRAFHRETGQPVALRVVSDAGLVDDRLRLAWWREIRQGLTTLHPYLCTTDGGGVLSADDARRTRLPEGSLWMATEWLEGPSLYGQRLPTLEAAPIISAVLRGLAHLHARGLRHGAVRLANLRRPGPGALPRLCDAGMDRIEAVIHEGGDLGSIQGPVLTDLQATAELVANLIPSPRSPAIEQWITTARGSRSRRPFTHAADARLAWEAAVGPAGRAPDRSSRSLPRPLRLGSQERPWPLIGRKTEQDALIAALRRVRAEGRPRAVVVLGAPGVGRTALVHALSVQSDEQGFARSLIAFHGPITTRSHGLTGMIARFLATDGMAPPLSTIRAESRLADLGIEEEMIRRFVPMWVEDGRGAMPVSPVEQTDLLLSLISRLAADKPVVIRLDEAHWSLEALDFAEQLLSRAGELNLPVLLLITVRSDLLSKRPAEAERVDRLRARPECETLVLEPLDAEAQKGILEELLLFSGPTARRLSEAAQGSPLYLHALVAELRRQGALTQQISGTWARVDDSAPLPADLAQIWEQRLSHLLDELAPDQSDAVELAAVLGGLVDPHEWREVCANEGVSVDPGLAEMLLHLDLATPLSRGAPGAWYFSHGLVVRAIIHRAVRRGKLADHHRAVARTLEAQVEDKSPLRQLRRFRHRLAAGELDAVFPAALRQARDHLTGGLLRPGLELTDLLSRAVEATEGPKQAERRAWIQTLLAEARLVEGRPDEAAILLHRTEITARAQGWTHLLVLTLLLRVRADRADRDGDAARERLAEADRLLQPSGPSWLRARTRMAAARQAMAHEDWEQAADELAEAIPLWEEAGEATGLGQCWLDLSRLAWVGGDPAAARRWREAAQRHFEASGAWLGLAEVRTVAGDQLRLQGDLAGARASYAAALRLADTIGIPGLFEAEVGRALLALSSAE
jgi:hypothetical protein